MVTSTESPISIRGLENGRESNVWCGVASNSNGGAFRCTPQYSSPRLLYIVVKAWEIGALSHWLCAFFLGICYTLSPSQSLWKKHLVSSLLMFLTRETISVLNWDEKGSSDDERTNIKQRPLGKKCHFGLGKRAIWEHSSPMSSCKSHLRTARRIFFNTGDRTVAEES